MTQALETLLPCPFCAVDIAEACPMEDGTAVCYHRHTESNCILDGMWFPTDKWNTRKPCDAGLREFDLERCHQCRKKLRSTHYITAVGVLCRACSRALSKGDATR